MSKAIGKHGWPTWRSIRGTLSPVNLRLKFRQDTITTLQKEGLSEDPKAIMSKVRTESIRNLPAAAAELWPQREKDIINLIFGSNYIELAGNNIDITIKICQKILRDEPYDPEEVSERDADYEKQREHLFKTLGRTATRNDVVRSRKEIVQHALAFNYVSDHIINGGEWTEDLIKQAHRILEDGLGDVEAPGQYREHACAVKYGDSKKAAYQFIRWQKIPEYMASLVKELNAAIVAAEDGEELDVYDRAARLHHYFINIHPFPDGNGRIVRILTAVFTLHYMGHVVVIGGDDEDREAYLEITKRAGKKFHEEDLEVSPSKQTGHHELGNFLARKSKQHLEDMRQWASKMSKKRHE